LAQDEVTETGLARLKMEADVERDSQHVVQLCADPAWTKLETGIE
jgi:hypothetical protein